MVERSESMEASSTAQKDARHYVNQQEQLRTRCLSIRRKRTNMQTQYFSSRAVVANNTNSEGAGSGRVFQRGKAPGFSIVTRGHVGL